MDENAGDGDGESDTISEPKEAKDHGIHDRLLLDVSAERCAHRRTIE